MLLNSLILAISSSIDSLGIGITYGIKNTKISYMAKVILFAISFSISILSIWFGNVIKDIFPIYITKFIGSFILILMGIFICFQALKKDDKNNISNVQKFHEEKIYSFFIKFLGITVKIIKNPIYSDLDKSNMIDPKEALFLGIALSLDSFVIGIGSSIMGISSTMFPLLVSIFQLIFLSFGNFLGRKLHSFGSFPDNIWSVFSGTLLVIIGVLKFWI